MSLELFHFIRPYWLLVLLPWFIILWLLINRHFSSGNWAKVCDPELLPHILITQENQRQQWPFYVLAIGGLLAILALAGPTWERLPQPTFSDKSALVILLDLSRSMDATDIKPSRLVRARFKVADILKQRQEGQTALVVYAGNAFTVTPLTDDTDTIASQLSILTTSLMPSQGNRADIAIKKAADLLKQAGLKNGHILLITDGLNKALYKKAIQQKHYKISILGVGTPQGSPIKLTNGGFLKDAQGTIVIPKLEETSLVELAQLGGGIYQRIQNDDNDIKALATVYNSNNFNHQLETNKLKMNTWREKGPWLLVLLLPLAALGFRRGLLSVILVIFFIHIPQPAQAWDWKSLWFTADQQASQAFNKGKIERSANLFKNPEWKGAAQYKIGKYKEVLKSLEGLEGAESWYNKGNALARLSRYPEAIKAYKKALELNPNHEDAKYNKDLVEKQLQKQQKNQSQQSKKKNSKKHKQNQQDSKSGDKQQSQSQQQEKQATKKDEKQSDKKQSKEKGENKTTIKYTPNENEQAKQQLLRQIPDDPGGLLRRKFKYQYKQQGQQSQGEQTW